MERETPPTPPQTHLEDWSGPSRMPEPCSLCASQPRAHVDPNCFIDPLWRRPCSEEAGGRVFRRSIVTLSLSKGSFPRNQEVTGATLASSL